MDGKFDAVSCTGYFGLSAAQRASFDASTTAAQVASAVQANVPSALRALQTHKNLGQQYGGGRDIKIFAYEAGQHADGQGNANLSYLPALYAAQTHPTMYEAYDDYVRGFYDMGGDLSLHYTYVSRNDRNGSWGALQSQTQPTANAPKYRSLLEAVSGTAYVPEYTIAVEQAGGEEFGTKPITFRVTRSGDRSGVQNVAFQLGGTATVGSDYLSPGTSIRFAAGQASALITVTPVDDTAIEDTETVTVTLLPGAGYKVDGVASRTTATGTITDDDGYVNAVLPIQNATFETGNLGGWSLVPATGNVVAVAPATAGGAVVNGPAAPAQGSRYAWGGGAAGNVGGGAMNSGIAQTFNLAAHAVGIDAGGARLTFGGWGVGWSGDFAQLEMRFYNAAGAQLGATVQSNRATTDKTWTRMTADAAVPALARSVELRATMQRTAGSVTDAGVDDLSARLNYAVVPTVDITATDARAAEPARTPRRSPSPARATSASISRSPLSIPPAAPPRRATITPRSPDR
jgi:hypothetical protein